MGRYVRSGKLNVSGITPSMWVELVFDESGDDMLLHHIEAGLEDGTAMRFVPVHHLSKKQRDILALEDENARLRVLVGLLNAGNDELRKAASKLYSMWACCGGDEQAPHCDKCKAYVDGVCQSEGVHRSLYELGLEP